MVVSAALLIRERGAHATAISDVLEHSRAPRGSAYHYFPGGRTQLLCEAVDYAGEHVAGVITEAVDGLELLDTLIEKYRRQLLDSDFRAGCPVVAVSVEPDEEDRCIGIERAAAAFDHWTDLIAQRFIADGIARRPGQRLGGAGDRGARGCDRAGPGAARPDAAGCRAPPAARLLLLRRRIRRMTAEWQPTACILCECNCGIVVQVEGRTLARIRGDKEHPGRRATPATRRCGWTTTRTTAPG